MGIFIMSKTDKMITITHEQNEWINERDINFSLFVREQLDELMEEEKD